MKMNKINDFSKLFILIIFCTVFFSCGGRVPYNVKTVHTGKIHLKNIDCGKDNLNFRIDTISILNTEIDSLLLQFHNNLNLTLDLTVVNKSENSVIFTIDRGDYEPPYFNWKINYNGKIDTIGFYNYNEVSEFNIKPNDSVKFSLKSIFYNFEKLLGKKTDYTNEILDILSDFELIYYVNEEKSCINQSNNTQIVVYNTKSKWSLW